MSNVSHYLSVKILTNNMCSVVLKGTSCRLQSNIVNFSPMKQSIPYLTFRARKCETVL